MQSWYAALACVLGACTFNPVNPSATDAPEAMPMDAPIEAIKMCEPGERICLGRNVETCNEEGSGTDAARTEVCGLGCRDDGANDYCVEASNVPIAMQTACTGTAPKLEPPAGATVTIEADEIECDPTCGSVTKIARTSTTSQGGGGAPMLATYCLGGVTIPAGVTVTVEDGVNTAIAWFVAGSVQIDGTIVASGGAATAAARGRGGPSGGNGGDRAGENQAGRQGAPQSCGGRGGGYSTSGTTAIGGGGAGGSHAAAGGTGGRGRVNGSTAAGGAVGSTCGAETLTPLGGGGGGGGGGDGTCGAACGWPGGGGGGALQISAMGAITIGAGGSIVSAGGAGHGSTDSGARRGGGGGGGAGGAVLLEAFAIENLGAVSVIGGAGGASGAGAGGAGATGGSLTGTNGTNETGSDQGGAGGGGSAGRVRVHAIEPACANVEPTGSCTTGPLRPTQR